ECLDLDPQRPRLQPQLLADVDELVEPGAAHRQGEAPAQLGQADVASVRGRDDRQAGQAAFRRLGLDNPGHRPAAASTAPTWAIASGQPPAPASSSSAATTPSKRAEGAYCAAGTHSRKDCAGKPSSSRNTCAAISSVVAMPGWPPSACSHG